LSFVGRAAFEAFGQSTPELYRHMTALLALRLRDTNDALLATNFLSVKGRVARALLSLAEAFGRDIGQGRILIRQKVSQSDLAAMAGIARENVSRVLNDWVHHSLVSRLAGYYCLENKAVLDREAEGGSRFARWRGRVRQRLPGVSSRGPWRANCQLQPDRAQDQAAPRTSGNKSHEKSSPLPAEVCSPSRP